MWNLWRSDSPTEISKNKIRKSKKMFSLQVRDRNVGSSKWTVIDWTASPWPWKVVEPKLPKLPFVFCKTFRQIRPLNPRIKFNRPSTFRFNDHPFSERNIQFDAKSFQIGSEKSSSFSSRSIKLFKSSSNRFRRWRTRNGKLRRNGKLKRKMESDGLSVSHIHD